ncbi:deoxyribonuclease II activity [Pleodorina starrii]|nr:deoxyribonuclease II activity [Pleodorina starrii]
MKPAAPVLDASSAGARGRGGKGKGKEPELQHQQGHQQGHQQQQGHPHHQQQQEQNRQRHYRQQQQQQQGPEWRGPRCLVAEGRGVDWWALLKYPGGQRAALLDSDSLPQSAPPPPPADGERASDGGRASGGVGGGGSGGGEDACWWRTGVDVNDPNGPLRSTLAAAAEAAAAAAAADGAAEGGGGDAAGSASSGGGGDIATGGSVATGAATAGSGRSGGDGGPFASAAAAAESASDWETGYVFYNDADPEGAEHWGSAHAKGLLLFGPSGGVWLSHSFPSFPARPPRRTAAAAPAAAAADDETADGGGGGLAESGASAAATAAAADPWDAVRHAQTVYGQHALCLTLPREDLERVAEALLVAQAYVYDHVMPYGLVEQYGAVQELIDASAALHVATGAGEAGGTTGGGGDAAATAAPTAQAGGGSTGDSGGGSAGGNAGGSGGGAILSRQLMSEYWRPMQISAQVLSEQTAAPPPPPPPQRNVSQQRLATLGGSAWLYVTKSQKHTVPYHEEVLEPLLGADMAWETWRVGASYGSKCPPDTLYDTLNVRRVVVPDCRTSRAAAVKPTASAAAADTDIDAAAVLARHADLVAEYGRYGKYGDGGGADDGGDGGDGGGEVIEWDSLQDHSKWGISTAGLMDVSYVGYDPSYEERVGTHVCLGDLNRQPSQRFRGGGYVCSADPWVWAAFRRLVAELEPCPAHTHEAKAE